MGIPGLWTHILPTTGPITLELHQAHQKLLEMLEIRKKVQEKRPGLASCLSHYVILCNTICYLI
jgi:hypothetical protein